MPEFAQRHRRTGLGAHGQHEQIAEVDAGRERNLQDDDRLLEIALACSAPTWKPPVAIASSRLTSSTETPNIFARWRSTWNSIWS